MTYGGTIIIIEGMKFKILSLNIELNNTPVFGFNMGFSTSNSREIKMTAETSNNNYIPMNKWFDDMLHSNNPASVYKKNINYNGVQLYGICPIDYTFTQNSIEVTFSIDHFDGDFNLFRLKQLRKEKLKKISEHQNEQ